MVKEHIVISSKDKIQHNIPPYIKNGVISDIPGQVIDIKSEIISAGKEPETYQM